jgi:transcriptional regulator with GAF, ATPase, and Fis domain
LIDLARALVRVAKVLVSETEPDAGAERLLRELCELTSADRGFIVVRDGGRYEQKFDVAFDRGRVSAEERRFSRTIVQRAITDRAVIETEEPATDPRFASVESVGLLAAGSVRVAPLSCADEVVAAIYLERRGARFAPEVGELLIELGTLAGPLIQRALERAALRQRNRGLERELFQKYDFTGIVTRDARMIELLRTVGQVADAPASILIRGETGTGKELIARALHVNSGRRRKPFVTLHCAALPETLLESELFGHVRGAFTGADRDRAGRLASADGGSLFLDEVGEIPLEAQAKLLRFLQFGELQRAGSDRIERVDVRVIAATHRDLATLVQDGRFRADLYFRLKVLELVVPPLRDRRGDIPLLVDAILARKWHRSAERPQLAPRALRCLQAYDYPGNVRELEHLIERACLLATGSEIDIDLLPPELFASGTANEVTAPAGMFARYDASELDDARSAAVAGVERAFLAGLLGKHGGNVSQAARDSGLNRTYLQRLIARYREGK